MGDSKYTARNANIVLGLFSPFKFELPQYKGYDITKFKDNIRFLKVYVNRDGNMGGVCPLFFDGAVCSFYELPRPENTSELRHIYNYLDNLRKPKEDKKSFIMMAISKIKNNLLKNKSNE